MTRSALDLVAAIAVGGMLVGGLVACAPAAPAPSVPPVAMPTSEPVFESEGEALAAAEKLYDEYVSVSDAVATGSASVDELRALVTESGMESELEGQKYLLDNGLSLTGRSIPYGFEGQTVDLVEGNVSFYVCLDISDSRVFDVTGADVTPSDQIAKQPFLVQAITDDDKLRIDSHQPWSGENFC
jgi:hypothetical protein